MGIDADNVNSEVREQWFTDFLERTNRIVVDLAMDEAIDEQRLQRWANDYLVLRSAEEEMNHESAEKGAKVGRRVARVKADFQTNLLSKELQENGLRSPVLLEYFKQERQVMIHNGDYTSPEHTAETLKATALEVGGILSTSEALYVVNDALIKRMEASSTPDTLRTKLRKLLVQVTRI
jgi:hypothetical protein